MEVIFDPTSERFNLLIIDPQVDFCEGGNLAVPGATDDIKRISDFINRNNDKINRIFVSLDTHTMGHIGHRLLRKKDKTPLDQFTTFKVLDDLKIVQSDNDAIEFEFNIDGLNDAYKKALTVFLQKYVNQLPKGYDGIAWPVHCLQGSDDWKIHPTLLSTLNQIESSGKVSYHIKGQNQLAEMYSIMKAEVPVENILDDMKSEYGQQIPFLKSIMYDPNITDNYVITPNTSLENLDIKDFNKYVPAKTFDSINFKNYNLKTTFNTELFNELTKDSLPIIICGEAKSHCVRASTRDIVEELYNKKLSNKVILINNGTSNVSGFDKSGEDFANDMKNQKLTKETNSLDNLNTGIYMIEGASTSGGRTCRNRKTRNNKMQKAGKRRSQRRIKRRISHRK